MEGMQTPASLVPPADAAPIFLGAAMGALMAVTLGLRWLPGLAASIAEPSPKVYWYLARASGLAAYWLLSGSVALGLMIRSKLSRAWPGGPVAVELHQFISLLTVVAALFHAVILLGDRHLDYAPVEWLVPFAGGGYRRLWVGLGQAALYVTAMVTLSFYVRRYIGQRTWRLLHYGSFAVYWLATAHGLGAGTDATAMMALYGLSGLTIYFLTVYRLLVSARQTPRVR
jgi:predicted ferric reductase